MTLSCKAFLKQQWGTRPLVRCQGYSNGNRLWLLPSWSFQFHQDLHESKTVNKHNAATETSVMGLRWELPTMLGSDLVRKWGASSQGPWNIPELNWRGKNTERMGRRSVWMWQCMTKPSRRFGKKTRWGWNAGHGMARGEILLTSS